MTDLGATCGGDARLEFPHNTLTQSPVCEVRKTKNCPNLNVGRTGVSRMGMCYR
jgi:hypothetical protein